jgi:hypothetical protein
VIWLMCASAQAAHRSGDDSARVAAQRAREAHSAGNYAASVRLYRASLSRSVDRQSPATWHADTLSALGESLRQLERNEESANILEQALRAYSIAGAVDTAAAARTRQRLAAVRLLQGRLAEARTQLALALGVLGERGQPSADRSSVSRASATSPTARAGMRMPTRSTRVRPVRLSALSALPLLKSLPHCAPGPMR